MLACFARPDRFVLLLFPFLILVLSFCSVLYLSRSFQILGYPRKIAIMKFLSFIALSFLLAHIPTVFAEETATVTLVEKHSSTFTLGQPHATTASDSTPSSTPTTFATSTSVVQATRHETQRYTAVPSASAGYGGYGSNAVNTEGGASGSSANSFNLSKGGLIAIIVVVVSVAVFGSEQT
jgi:hypothetical protein